MLLAGLICLTVAVIVSNAPVPQGSWIAIFLAVIALILICLSGTRGSFTQIDTTPSRSLMSCVETRSHRVAQPVDQTRRAVYRSGDVRFFVVVPS